MTPLRCAWDWLSLEPHQRKGLRALQVCLGLMLLFRASTEARFAPFLWGPHGIGEGSSAEFLSVKVARFADLVYATNAGVFALVLLMGLGAGCLVYGYRTRIAGALALVTFLLLGARLPELGDGGDNVTRLVLTYMLFALPHGKEPKRGSLAVWLHNVAILAIGLQIGVLYLTSGFLKATGAKWSNGTAMYLISQVEWFSHPGMRSVFRNAFATTFASYSAMFFQIWFPVAIWTRLRPMWIAVAILFHLGIALFMGLVCFSLAMIGLELFLIRDHEYARMRAWFTAHGTHFFDVLAARRLIVSDGSTCSRLGDHLPSGGLEGFEFQVPEARELTFRCGKGVGGGSAMEKPMPYIREPLTVPDCVRCGARMTPSSLGIARLALTPPGRSRLRRGVRAHIHVCPRCGHVELTASDPSAFLVRGS
jgi:hypothetical protein